MFSDNSCILIHYSHKPVEQQRFSKFVRHQEIICHSFIVRSRKPMADERAGQCPGELQTQFKQPFSG